MSSMLCVSPLEDGSVVISRVTHAVDLSGAIHARRSHEPVPVRLLRQCAEGLYLHGRTDTPLPVEDIRPAA